ncbi:MAG: glycosyltransferase [Bacteroidota bacterium]
MTVDIIILSYAKNNDLREITLNCLESLAASENPNDITLNVLVIESNKAMQPYQYPGTTTLYPDISFGYNKYMNIGINATNSPFVCMCNNDLVFEKNWATEILEAFKQYPSIQSANPYCKNFDYDKRIVNGANVIRRDQTLDMNGVLTGWCIFVKRSIFKKIGLLDEQFTFWFADNDYDMILRKHGIQHALVKSSSVTHLGCQSHDLLLDKKEELTTGQRAIFDKKWGNKIRRDAIIKKLKSFVRL